MSKSGVHVDGDCRGRLVQDGWYSQASSSRRRVEQRKHRVWLADPQGVPVDPQFLTG